MDTGNSFPAPVGISARHVHLSHAHIQLLFGGDLHVYRELSQIGEFAAEERVAAVTTRGAIHNIRVLGPARIRTQLELAKTDAISLGLSVPVRLSGNLDGTPGITLVGVKGSVTLNEGVIIPARHLHITQMEANRFGLSQNQVVQALAGSDRQIQFNQIVVRIADSARLELHLDTDEANAANIVSGDTVHITIPDQSTPVSDRLTYVTVEDIHALIRAGTPLKLSPRKRITPAALELAKARGVLISE
jgi:putative phosphotransacetylase